MEFTGDDDVGDETTAAAREPGIFDAMQRCADAFRGWLGRGVYCNSSRRRSSRS